MVKSKYLGFSSAERSEIQILLISGYSTRRIVSALIGSYIGGHIAVKKGSQFVINVLIGLMVLFGFYMIFVW